MKMKRKRSTFISLLLFTLLIFLIFSLKRSVEPPKKTLVMIAYHEASPLYIFNLEYFLKVGVIESSSIDYTIMVNGDRCTPCQQPLPSNVKIMFRKNGGFDFGGYHDILEEVDFDDYEYYIFFNGGVRGPILPSYDVQNIQSQWHLAFTDRLRGKVKLVGPSISCEVQVHVQTHMFALHRDGLEAAWDDKIFISTGKTIEDITAHSEFGLTDSIFAAGYTIDCLLQPYQGWDWKSIYNSAEKGAERCNGGRNPLIQYRYGSGNGGYSISPLETVFHKRGGSVRMVCDKPGPGRFGEPNICETDAAVDDMSFWILDQLQEATNRRNINI